VTDLDPAANPYVQWILAGRHTTALPLALRPEHFETIRANLDRLEWRRAALRDYLAGQPAETFDRYNLSDIFEYMSEGDCHQLLEALAERGKGGGRLVYWNLFVERSRPEHLAQRLRPLPELAATLHAQDKAFFYSRLVIEEITHP
jgi:S-adenosylmethionine-diacylglycerol 3-amino-3-carboxypropyl transferase